MQEEMKKTLFEECGKRFNKEESPLEWFVNHDCEKIIVLTRQT
jgi:predicted lipid carrier protein YhbT